MVILSDASFVPESAPRSNVSVSVLFDRDFQALGRRRWTVAGEESQVEECVACVTVMLCVVVVGHPGGVFSLSGVREDLV